MALAYFLISSKMWGGVASDDVHFYYFLNTLDAVFCIINCHAVIDLCHWLARYLPDAVIKAATILSGNINTIYIAQWFFVPLTVTFISYFAKNLVLNDIITSVISIAMIILATAVALGYKKLRTVKN